MSACARTTTACRLGGLALLVTHAAVAQQPATTTTAPPPNGMQAGGLAPPPPMPGDPVNSPSASSATERQLDRSEQEDSGRGLEFFYFNVEAGYEQIGLQTLKSDGLTYADAVPSKDSGLMVGAGAGLKLVFFTFGARARVGMFSQWNVTTLNAEFGIHIPIGDIEPHFTLGGGYAFLGGIDEDNWGGGVSIKGYDVRGGFGLDYYVTPVFSIGGSLTGEVLGLTRPGVDLSAAATSAQPGALDAQSQEVASADGSSLGAAFTASAVLGLHF